MCIRDSLMCTPLNADANAYLKCPPEESGTNLNAALTETTTDTLGWVQIVDALGYSKRFDTIAVTIDKIQTSYLDIK